MKNIARLLLVVIIFTVCFSMAGCTVVDYNAKALNSGYSVNHAWMSNNLTKGAMDADSSTELPKTRIFIITDQKTLDEIFTKFPKVDFEKEMVLIYCHTDSYSRKYVVEDIVLYGDTLTVKLGVASGLFDEFIFSTSLPFTRICVIKLDKVEAENINIVF